MKPKYPPMVDFFADVSDLDLVTEPKTIIDKWRRNFILRNIEPVHRKLTELINKNPEEETKERELQVKTLHKFAESIGSLGSEEKQAASVTKIYQKNTLIIQNPVIQQIIQDHCKRLAPDLFQKKLENKEE